MSGSTSNTQDGQDAISRVPTAGDKPIVIGIYGISGSGKSFLLNQLMLKLGTEHFDFYEGSEMIASLVPGGLAAFKMLDEEAKTSLRRSAIERIAKTCIVRGKGAIVTGHFTFWSGKPHRVCTPSDMDVFTHIIYLDTSPETVAQRCREDTERNRQVLTLPELKHWQEAEVEGLRHLCQAHGILFVSTVELPALQDKVAGMLRDFCEHNEAVNTARAQCALDRFVARAAERKGLVRRTLVVDGDRTVVAEDTGAVFWKVFNDAIVAGDVDILPPRLRDNPLKRLFQGPLRYTYTAFRQATLLYEEALYDDRAFDIICDKVASTVDMHPEMKLLLGRAAEQDHVAAVVVTCGLRRVWEKILDRAGLAGRVGVIGGGRIADGFVVTAKVKANLVTRLRDTHRAYVWAFGDSSLDLPMLHNADESIVVVGQPGNRSTTMGGALQHAINVDGLKARQVLLPPHDSPRMDREKLPIVKLDDGFIDNIFRNPLEAGHRIVHATDRDAARLLATPMRDASISGSALRRAHGNVGAYLAAEFVAGQVGLESFAMPHVQGHVTQGQRLFREKDAIVVALMRGGEPMALGVSDVFQQAAFLHAKQPADVRREHLRGGAVLLVDGVINTGDTVVQFVEHVRALDVAVPIVVIAGVVQTAAVCLRQDRSSQPVGRLGALLERDSNLSLVALRMSDNRFTGVGTTDTGNRLFNTTHL